MWIVWIFHIIRKKQIIYNPLKYYYYNGLKFVKDKKSVKELIECFNF